MRKTYRYWFWLRTGIKISVLAWDRHKTIGIGTRHENIDSVLGKAKKYRSWLWRDKKYRYCMGQAQQYKSRIRSKKIGSGIGQAQINRSWLGTGTKRYSK